MSAKPTLSVVIPVFNEAANIGQVLAEVAEVLSPVASLDVILVDDGSEDHIASLIPDLMAQYPFARYILHPKRSGKSAALRTGFLVAKGVWVATMDGDGQDDPRAIADMVTKVDLSKVGSIGLVAGVRLNRTDGANRKWASRFANALRQSLLNDDCPDTACGLKLVARDVFLAMPFFDALHRYLPAWAKHLGFETDQVEVKNRPRASGVSKYSNLGRAFAGFFDLLGVVWLMQRTHVPSRELLLRARSLPSPDQN